MNQYVVQESFYRLVNQICQLFVSNCYAQKGICRLSFMLDLSCHSLLLLITKGLTLHCKLQCFTADLGLVHIQRLRKQFRKSSLNYGLQSQFYDSDSDVLQNWIVNSPM